MKPSYLLSLLLIGLLLSSCGGIEIPADKLDYIGLWQGDGVSLQITADAKLNYSKKEGSNTTTLNVPISAFEGDNFKAGLMGMETTFVVSQPPTKKGGQMTMIVDGTLLKKR